MVPVVRLVELSDLFLPKLFSVKEHLLKRAAAAHFSFVRPLRIMMLQPCPKYVCSISQRMIQFPPEGNLVKLVQYGFVEALADAVCLRMTCTGLGVLYSVYAQIEDKTDSHAFPACRSIPCPCPSTSPPNERISS